MKRRLINTLIPLVLLIAGSLTYGFSLRLPLFLDDVVHFRWLQGQDWGDILVSARGIGYYRPLPFLLWKALWIFQGKLHAPTLHGVNLVLHLFNSLLVWGILRWQWREKGQWVGVASALLFLLYPFSYQAVPWVGALAHPLVAALILGSLYLYRMADSRSSCFLKALSIALAFIAPLAHETGILAAPLLSLLLLTGDQRISLPETLRRTQFHWLGNLTGLGVWLAVPKGVSAPYVWNLEARYQNGVYFLQGFAYPVAPLARKILVAGGRVNDLQAILIVCGTVSLVWGWLLWKTGKGRLLALALGWFCLTIAPAWLILGFNYVVDAPRLLYTSSVGSVLFWSAPLAIAWKSPRLERIGKTLALIATMVIAIAGYNFIFQRAAIYEQVRLWMTQFIAAVRSLPESGPILCVNCPQFLAPREPTFAVGHEGVPIWTTYHRFGDLLWVNGERERDLAGVIFPDIQRSWKYLYGGVEEFHTWISLQEPLRQATGVLLTDYERDDIAVYPVGALEAENVPPQDSFLADFDGHMRLLSANVYREGESVWVELHWQSVAVLSDDVTVFLHVVDDSGQLVAQRDGYPLMGLSRPVAWQPGDVWRDLRRLQLREGKYQLLVGLYTVEDGLRLPATDPLGRRFPDDAVPIVNASYP